MNSSDAAEEAREQQAAIAEILDVISRTREDVAPVFQAIARAAHRLVRADAVVAARFEDGLIHPMFDTDPEPASSHGHGSYSPTQGSLAGRVILSGAPVLIHDLQTDPDYDRARFGTSMGDFHRGLGVPLLREGRPVGTLNLWWRTNEVVPERYIALMETFAHQAVIAIENARFFKELQTRNQDLIESLRQQTATAEILRVISASPADVTPVFEAIVGAAKELCGSHWANLNLCHDGFIELKVSTREFPGRVRGEIDRSTLSGRVVLARAPVGIESLQGDSEYSAEVRARSFASLNVDQCGLGVPLLRNGEPIGTLVNWWRGAGAIPEKLVPILRTFADQAVIAIENVRLFKEIQEKNRLLEIAGKHKSDFLAHMSHELRTPLNAIIGFSEVMASDMAGEITDQQKEFVGDIRDAGKHLLMLINDILDLSKIEAGRMEIDVAQFAIPLTVENALTLVRGRAEKIGIKLDMRIAPDVDDCWGDERKVKQILLNLLGNAVKFTPAGGTVTLSAHRVGEDYVISVKDTGIGIAPQDQERLFEEFSQVGSDQARKAEGTGLGLALTRKLVVLHGGRIWVESSLGSGSAFSFTLPAGRHRPA